jgi:Ca2+-binding RTX toxin-like protein
VTMRALLSAVLLCLLAAAPARAGEAALSGSELRVTASAGEANRIHVEVFSDGDYLVVDDGAPLALGPGCTRSQSGGAICAGAGVASVRIETGDGDDVVTTFTVAVPVTIDGGPGADELSGGIGRSTVLGGDGDDYLTAPPSPTPVGYQFDGGAGDDVISAVQEKVRSPGQKTETYVFQATRDSVTCGSGSDRVSADALDAPLDGCEDVTTFVAQGTIRLTGTSGPDRIALGRSFSYRVDAGAGDDLVRANNGARDYVRCGAGRDVVVADRRDRIASDCERVRRTR